MDNRAKRMECVQLAGAFVRRAAVRKQEQAPRTPCASRSSVTPLLLCGFALKSIQYVARHPGGAEVKRGHKRTQAREPNLEHIDHQIEKSITKLDTFQADYKTTGDFEVSTLSDANSAIQAAVKSGRFAGVSALLSVEGLTQFKSLVQKAKTKLDSIRHQ